MRNAPLSGALLFHGSGRAPGLWKALRRFSSRASLGRGKLGQAHVRLGHRVSARFVAERAKLHLDHPP